MFEQYSTVQKLNRVKRKRNLTRVEVALGVTGSPVVELELIEKNNYQRVLGQKYKYNG